MPDSIQIIAAEAVPLISLNLLGVAGSEIVKRRRENGGRESGSPPKRIDT